MEEYAVKCWRDDEAGVWIAESDDLPGLILEDVSLDALMRRVRDAIPELAELNRIPLRGAVRFFVERCEKLTR